MGVPHIGAWDDAKPYLLNLKETVDADIRHLLSASGFAPFAIFREVMSYIDHLGHLYTGSTQVGSRYVTYMSKLMTQVDSNYKNQAQVLYQMYRCGPVHEFKPKTLENKKGKLLAWYCYKGNRTTTSNQFGSPHTLKHLVPLNPYGDHKYWLPVSTQCLIDDLEESIKLFIQATPQNERVTAWNRAFRELSPPHPFEFVV